MKKVISAIIILLNITLTGCFNYKDINKAYFVTATFIDINEDGMVELYEEAFKAVRSGEKVSSEKGQRIIFKGTGKTAFEAVRDTNTMSSYKLNFTQNRAIIFTEKAARYGIDQFIDFFERDQELINRAYIAIYVGDLKDLFKAQLKEEEYVGLFLPSLIQNVGSSSRAVELQLNDFLVKRLEKNNAAVITAIELKKDNLGEKIKTSGGGIVHNDKLVGLLEQREGQGYNFLVNAIKTGTLEISNPSSPDKFVTLEILRNRTKTEITYDGENVHLKKIIHTKTTLGEVQNKFNFSKSNLERVSNIAEQNIIRACRDVFEKYKEKNIDIFDVENSFHRKYPHVNSEDIIKKTYLELEVRVNIEGSSDTQGFR